MFVIFFVAGSMLGMGSGQYLFYALVLLSSLFGSLCFLLFTKKTRHAQPAPVISAIAAPETQSAESFSRLIDSEIASSALLLIKIGGYIMFFSIFAALLRQLPVIPYYAKLLLGGILEITTGDAMIAASPLSGHAKIILSLAATAFGGLSAAAQTNSVLQNTGLPLSRYVMIKVLAGLFGLLLGVLFF